MVSRGRLQEGRDVDIKGDTFFEKLRDDMLQTRHRRFQYQLAKIASIGSLVGIGSLVVEKTNLALFFYIIPFVAVAFDFFILCESFTMRRMSAFVRHEKSNTKDGEFRWERFVKNNPDFLSRIANIILTGSSAIGSFLILFLSALPSTPWFQQGPNIVWLLVVLVSVCIVPILEWRVTKKVWSFGDDPRG